MISDHATAGTLVRPPEGASYALAALTEAALKGRVLTYAYDELGS